MKSSSYCEVLFRMLSKPCFSVTKNERGFEPIPRIAQGAADMETAGFKIFRRWQNYTSKQLAPF